MNKKRPETTYNEQEMTWNDMEQPSAIKKRHETTQGEQKTAWNDLQRTDSKFMELLYLKNNQLEGSNVTKKQ